MNPAEGKMTDDDHLFDDAPQGVTPRSSRGKALPRLLPPSPSRKRR